MIRINIDPEFSEYEIKQLESAFNRIINLKYIRKNPENISIIYKIIDLLPLPKILEEFIFSSHKYHILIKHDALIRAIELDYAYIIERVLTESNNVELLKTAIMNVENDHLLKMLAMGLTNNIPRNKRNEIQKLALNNIKDPQIFSNTFKKILNKEIAARFFRKIRYKSHYRTFSKLQKRILPLIIPYLSKEEIITELTRKNKYPLEIRNSILHSIAILFDLTTHEN